MDYLTTIHTRLGADFYKHPHLNLGGHSDDTHAHITTHRGDDITITHNNVATGRGVTIRLHALGTLTATATLWDQDETALVDTAVATAQRMINSLAVPA